MASIFDPAKIDHQKLAIRKNPQFLEFLPQILNLSWPNIETLGVKVSKKSLPNNLPKLTSELVPNSLGIPDLQNYSKSWLDGTLKRK